MYLYTERYVDGQTGRFQYTSEIIRSVGCDNEKWLNSQILKDIDGTCVFTCLESQLNETCLVLYKGQILLCPFCSFRECKKTLIDDEVCSMQNDLK